MGIPLRKVYLLVVLRNLGVISPGLYHEVSLKVVNDAVQSYHRFFYVLMVLKIIDANIALEYDLSDYYLV